MRAPRAKKVAAAALSPQKRQMHSMSTRPIGLFPSGPLLNPLADIERRYIPTAEEDEEFRLTVGDMTKKRGFTIFQDIPEVSPGRTETPLEDHRYRAATLPKTLHDADQNQTQIRFLEFSWFAHISEQFNKLEPYPCLANPSSQTDNVPGQWQGEWAS